MPTVITFKWGDIEFERVLDNPNEDIPKLGKDVRKMLIEKLKTIPNKG